MAERTGTVQATFGGKRVSLALSRDRLATASLEAAIGSAFGAFGRFQGRSWTLQDVRMVLAHAYPGACLLHGITQVPTVDATLDARPAAFYAPLAVKILEAYLFGLDVGQAVYDEDAA